MESEPLPGFRPVSRRSLLIRQLRPGGEREALRRVEFGFVDRDIHRYDRDRDQPALEATSRLSPDLSTGALSPRSRSRRGRRPATRAGSTTAIPARRPGFCGADLARSSIVT
ncbi:MAG: hypothetical protein U5R48_15170 [Gammaproteobacteria bacterium]|nr:hypothetical protein [Gammaproteobacteria bacterium]